MKPSLKKFEKLMALGAILTTASIIIFIYSDSFVFEANQQMDLVLANIIAGLEAQQAEDVEAQTTHLDYSMKMLIETHNIRSKSAQMSLIGIILVFSSLFAYLLSLWTVLNEKSDPTADEIASAVYKLIKLEADQAKTNSKLSDQEVKPLKSVKESNEADTDSNFT